MPKPDGEPAQLRRMHEARPADRMGERDLGLLEHRTNTLQFGSLMWHIIG
jgi:hypothetical protein